MPTNVFYPFQYHVLLFDIWMCISGCVLVIVVCGGIVRCPNFPFQGFRWRKDAVILRDTRSYHMMQNFYDYWYYVFLVRVGRVYFR